MALGGRELRLILSIQSYGTTNINRLRRDLAALGSITDIQNRKQLAQARLARRALQLQDLEKEARALRNATALSEAKGRAVLNIAKAENAIRRTELSQIGVEQSRLAVEMQRVAANEKILALKKEEAVIRSGVMMEEARLGIGRKISSQEGAIAKTKISQLRNDRALFDLETQRLVLTAKQESMAEQGMDSRDIRSVRVDRALKSNAMQFRILAQESGNLGVMLSEQRGKMTELEREATRLSQASNVDAEALDTNRRAREKVSLQMESFALTEQKLGKQSDILRNSLGIQRAELANLEHQYKELQAVGRRDQDAIIRNRAARAELTAQIRMEQQALDELTYAERIQGLQRKQLTAQTVAQVGRTAQFAGLLMTAAFGGSAVAAANFSTEARSAATQMRDIGAPIAQTADRAKLLEETILFGQGDIPSFMQRFPASADEMAKSTYDLFSAINLFNKEGIADLDRGFQLLEVANKAAVAGNVELEESTDALITVYNNFVGAQGDVNDVMDTAFDIIRFGRMRMSDFNAMMQKVAPAAKDAGQSLEDVGGTMVLFTERVPSQARAATMLARSLDVLHRPEIRRGLEQLGVPVRNIEGGFRPLPELMADIARKFPTVAAGQEGVAELFQTLASIGRLSLPEDLKTIPDILEFARKSGIRLSKGIILREEARRGWRLMLSNIEQLQNRQDQIIKNKGEFEAAWEAMREAPGVQWKILINQFKALILIVGREALPVFISIGEKAVWLVDQFRELSEGSRGSIVRWLTWIGVGSLLVGTLVNVAASLFSMIINVRLLTIGLGLNVAKITAMATAIRTLGVRAALAAGSLAPILAAVSRLGALGVIAITLKVLWTGDMDAKDFLIAAGAGGLFGARFGVIGAAVGAVTVPIVLKIISEKTREKSPIEELYNRYVKETREGQSLLGQILATPVPLAPGFHPEFQELFGGEPLIKSLKEFERQFKQSVIPLRRMEDAHERLGQSANDASMQEESLRDQVSRLTNEFIAGEVSLEQYTDAVGQAGVQIDSLTAKIVKLIKKGNFAKASKLMDAFAMKAEEAVTSANVGRLVKEAVQAGDVAKVQDLLNEYQSTVQSALEDSAQAAEDYQKALKDATEQAHEDMVDSIDQAVDKIAEIYDRFEQVNRQAMGSIFGGPTMQGIFGDIFSSLNDTLRQFGVQIPVPFQILRRDMDQQLAYFRRWRGGINKLLKRGVPLELVQEIQELGPNAIPMIEGLLGANDKQLKGYVSQWKKGQKLIRQAARSDMKKQLDDYLKHGKDIAWQIIMGISSDPAQAKLKEGFKTYVVKTFGDVLREEMAQSIADATKQAAEDLKTAQAAAGAATGANIPPNAVKEANRRAAARATRTAARAARRAEDIRVSKLPIEDLTLAQVIRQAGLAAGQIRRLRQGGVSERERQRIMALRRRRQALLNRKRDLEYTLGLQDTHNRYPRMATSGTAPTNVTVNQGDRTTINASGATTDAVTRALNKKSFRQKNRGKKR